MSPVTGMILLSTAFLSEGTSHQMERSLLAASEVEAALTKTYMGDSA